MPGPDRPPTGALAVADRNDARDADFAAYLEGFYDAPDSSSGTAQGGGN